MIEKNHRPQPSDKPTTTGIVFVFGDFVPATMQARLRAAVLDALQSDNPSEPLPIGDIESSTRTINCNGAQDTLTVHTVKFERPVRSDSLQGLIEEK